MTAWTLRRASHDQWPDPDWFRCNYLLAVGHAVLAQAYEADPDVSLPEGLSRPELHAKAYASEVATALEETLLVLTRRRGGGADTRALQEFLTALEPTILLLLAGVTRRWGPPAQEKTELGSAHAERRDRDRAWLLATLGTERLSDRVTGVTRGWGPPVREKTELGNAHAERRDRDRAWLLATLGTDRLSDRAIVDYVTKLQLDYRARYNLACYYAGRGDDALTEEGTTNEDYRQALSELSEALKTAPADLIDWASNDPSLTRLRKDPEFGPKFDALISELSKEEPGQTRDTKAE